MLQSVIRHQIEGPTYLGERKVVPESESQIRSSLTPNTIVAPVVDHRGVQIAKRLGVSLS